MIRTEIGDGIGTVTLDRPHRLNALTWETMTRLHDAIEKPGRNLFGDPAVTANITRFAGR